MIAVKPSYAGSGVAFRSFSSPGVTGAGSSNAAGEPENARVVYIGVCKDEHILTCRRKNVEAVVWFVDAAKEFNVGDYVTFDIDEGKTKSIELAKNVAKSKVGGIPVPGGILSKLAVLASVLLLLAIMNDTRR